MKYILIIIALSSIYNCTVIGFLADVTLDKKSESENVEKKGNKNEESGYDNSFTKIGTEIDAAIVLKILSPKENIKKEDIDDRACPEEGTRQTCTNEKGCWCEKI